MNEQNDQKDLQQDQPQPQPQEQPQGDLAPQPDEQPQPQPPQQEQPQSQEPPQPTQATEQPIPAPAEAEPVVAQPVPRAQAAQPEVPRHDDVDLDAEIQAALGDASLSDLYDFETTDAVAEVTAKTQGAEETPPDGVVRGKVVGISGDDIFIDLGGKSQGLLRRDELEEGEVLEPGQIVNIAVVGYDRQDGLVILSKRTAEQQLLRRNLRRGVRVEARVVGSNKGGLEMDIKGLRAFMPASQISFDRVEDLDSLTGERWECEVTEVEKGDRNIVLSRRKILEEEQAHAAQRLWEEIEEGQTHTGIVRRIADYGAFVDVGGADGLLHVSEMSWARVKHPNEVLQEGQTVDVRVIGVDREKNRIALSLKQAHANPWTTAAQKYPVGMRLQARVTNLQDFGAFAELEPGVEGLIPISEMSWAGRIRHPRDVVESGATVEVEVLRIEPERQKMALSMRAVQANPWVSIADKYQPNEIYTGRVARLTDFGAFVTLEDGIDGLVHISEMADKHVNRPGDIVSEGQTVQVRVLSVDEDNQRIALSLKTQGQAPAEDHAAAAEEARHRAAQKKDRPRRGGLQVNEDDAASKLGLHMNF